MKKPRYNFYSHVHRYVRSELFGLSMKLARVDFRVNAQATEAKNSYDQFKLLIKGHAAHEDNTVHELFRKANSDIHKSVEDEHEGHDALFEELDRLIDEVIQSQCKNEKHLSGYNFYLKFNKFVSVTLDHLEKEEKVLMTELQSLYPDSKIRAVTFKTYDHMEPEQLLHMTQTIFPHVNAYEREVFINDIYDSHPEKLEKIWPEVSKMLSVDEREYYRKNLNIKQTSGKTGSACKLYYKWQSKPEGDSSLAETFHENRDDETSVVSKKI